MSIEFTKQAWKEFEYWLEHDIDVADKIRALLKSIIESPFKGIGKPEPLKYQVKGFWSRRITLEHRLVYRISGKGLDQKCSIIQCRFHYDE